jgi:hypothetical protein
MRRAVKELPPGLDKTFMRSIDSIMALPECTARQCLRALYWLAYARVPLSSSKLIEAIAIGDMDGTWDPDRIMTPQDLTTIAYNCANLISLEKEDGDERDVHLCHSSVKDFLVQHSMLFSMVLPKSITPNNSSIRFLLAHDCLRYLSIVLNSQTIFFGHVSQHLTYYLRGTAMYAKDLCDSFVAIVGTVVARDILRHYKCSPTCK